MYIEGNLKLWPKGAIFAKPGKLTVHIGPVQQPENITVVYQNYIQWVKTIDPTILPDDLTDENEFSNREENLQQLTSDEEEMKEDYADPNANKPQY